jgi:Putative zinc-finger
MSVVDLHPENLLDKEIRGELDGPERQRLEIHLAQCATCRLERQLRADFALDLSRGSIPPDIARLVESLARQGAEPPVPVVAPRRGRRVKVVLLTVAATLTVVAGAFASTEAGRRAMAPLFGRQADVAAPYGEATRPAATPVPRAQVAAPSTASLPTASLPAAALATASLPVASLPAVPLPAPLSLPASPAAGPPARVESGHATAAAAPEPRSPAAAPADGPAPLFLAEADARRRGDTARMLELHAQLVARYPQSHEAQVSRMMVARLLLDRGDAGGALSGFDAYLRAGSGELREDALAGRATALDRLGRTEEGRLGWLALLDQYPNTAYGTHARSRVEAPGAN